MEGFFHDYPTTIIVHSESESGISYFVDLCANKVGDVYAGRCSCPNFMLGDGRKPSLQKQIEQSGFTKILRCKHIRYAREQLLDMMLPKLHEANPNKDEPSQTYPQSF